jgi:hypothetical protein
MLDNKYLDFLNKVKHLNWSVLPSGRIRTDKGECPICAYANVKLGTKYTTEVFSALNQLNDLYGLTEVDNFTSAADGYIPPTTSNFHRQRLQELRAQILTRLNLNTNAE